MHLQHAWIAAERFGYGARPNELARIAKDLKGWLRAQVDAESSSPPGLKHLPLIADMRGVFKGLLRDHLGLDEEILESPVFPGSRDVPTYENLVRA